MKANPEMPEMFMKCPNCKENKMRSFEGPIDLEGVEVFARGQRCGACGELIFDTAQVEELEQQRAVALVKRGVRTGAEFKFVRKRLDLKATELADLMDVDPKTVSRWETGEVGIPRLVAFALGEIFNRPRVVPEQLRAFASR